MINRLIVILLFKDVQEVLIRQICKVDWYLRIVLMVVVEDSSDRTVGGDVVIRKKVSGSIRLIYNKIFVARLITTLLASMDHFKLNIVLNFGKMLISGYGSCKRSGSWHAKFNVDDYNDPQLYVLFWAQPYKNKLRYVFNI